jgi:hypothetical protein
MIAVPRSSLGRFIELEADEPSMNQQIFWYLANIAACQHRHCSVNFGFDLVEPLVPPS